MLGGKAELREGPSSRPHSFLRVPTHTHSGESCFGVNTSVANHLPVNKQTSGPVLKAQYLSSIKQRRRRIGWYVNQLISSRTFEIKIKCLMLEPPLLWSNQAIKFDEGPFPVNALARLTCHISSILGPELISIILKFNKSEGRELTQ